MGGPVTKIATCCYCGTRAALVLRGKDRHELACANCGAPLHALKMLKAPQAAPEPIPAKKRAAPLRRSDPERRRKRSPKRTWRWRLRQIAELLDDLEDLFD